MTHFSAEEIGDGDLKNGILTLWDENNLLEQAEGRLCCTVNLYTLKH